MNYVQTHKIPLVLGSTALTAVLGYGIYRVFFYESAEDRAGIKVFYIENSKYACDSNFTIYR